MNISEPSTNTRRTATLGRIKDLASEFSKEFSCEIFRRTCVSHAFELRAKQEIDNENIKCLVYLSLGQESISAGISTALGADSPWILGQHRAHATYLTLIIHDSCIVFKGHAPSAGFTDEFGSEFG
jgi:TPP-dependent pyruvate/acetoin dehydrogenase alpha subunit